MTEITPQPPAIHPTFDKSCTFCPLPWNSINIRNNGDLRICCNANSYTANRGIIRKEDGTPYNASKDDLDDARNSELSKDVRATMLRGEWHAECKRCQNEEESGVLSRRQMEFADWDLTPEYAEEHTEEDGAIVTDNHPLEFFDIRYGNFCNLKCRMCGPTDSHQWYGDFVELTGKTSYKDTHELIQLEKNDKGRWDTKQYDWFKGSNMYWNNFEKYTKDAKKLYIVGGEPLIIDEHIDTLERLVVSGRASEMQIEYNTNLTNVTTKILNLWKEFKEIRIGASIDGFEGVFNYQRFPASWDTVYTNLRRMEERKDINFKCWFAYTITPLNLFHFPEFMKWKLDRSKLELFNPIHSWRPIVSFHMCHSPKYYNIKVLPQELKEEVVDHFDSYRPWILESDHNDNVKKFFIKHLDSVEKFMLSESYTEEYWPEFVSVTKKLDTIRAQDINKVVPQYKRFFE